MNISKKLMFVFSIFIILILLNSGVSFQIISKMNDIVSDITSNRLSSVVAAYNIKAMILDYRRAELQHALADDAKEIQEFDVKIKEAVDHINEAREAYKPLISSDDEMKIYENFDAKYKKYALVSGRMLELSRENKDDEARRLQAESGNALFEGMMSDLGLLVNLNRSSADDAKAVQVESAAMARIWLGVGVGVFVVMAGALGMLLHRVLAVPITAMTQSMQRLASGDLSVEIPARGRSDEIGQMAQTVEVFRENAQRAEHLAAEEKRQQTERDQRAQALRSLTTGFDTTVSGVLDVVSRAAGTMETTARTMSATAQQSSRQATEVASATEEASASVQTVASASEELSSSINEIGRQMEQAILISQAASQDAERTTTIVQSLADASGR
ncbi:MCP four helix bundle domain-containing protein, partial [Pararhodospirillum oryzae]|uniref:MCP four helix bundle domain-containing protein n=1 Tax=Pararhodospirillum oryzae TaxID=478448 RepID=UPI0024828D2F